MKHNESKLQQACVRWFRMQYPDKIIFAIPNGGKRDIREASRLKAEGVLAGVPDLFVAEPRHNICGLFIEMKFGDGKLTESQRQMMMKFHDRNYLAFRVATFHEFEKLINSYFKD